MAKPLPENFLGSFKLEKSEKFDEYLTARGVNWFLRKMMGAFSITKIFKKEEESYVLSTITPKGTFVYNFKFDIPFETVGFDGKKHRITMRMDIDGKSVIEEHVRFEESEDVEAYKYHVDGDYLILEMEAGDVVCRRFMKRQ